MRAPPGSPAGMAMQIAKPARLARFIRLGPMLALERRPVQPRARAMFIQTRAQTCDELAETMRGFMPDLTEARIHLLVTYAMAGAEGLFIAKEIGGDGVI